MSASREVVARANGVTEEKCSCRFCNHHSTYINDMMWCLAWDCAVRADSFCTFLSPQTDNSEPHMELEPITGEYNRYHGELDVRNGTLTIYGSDRCVCCGAVVPEGRMVCPTCERKANNGR